MEKNAGTVVGPHMLVSLCERLRIKGPRGGELSQLHLFIVVGIAVIRCLRTLLRGR